ncbi:uncharacterized protein BJ212DRAFT_1325845 [Suillus subaureus]|uniref:Lipid droplet-associated perilipin protein n=1 Tax=Suillus subaureus TaxID=48587 RepID=A0A9P7JHM1_9AGAM|nr:uncharacterized protein BJ212DRAFT_1325845 [Suillus subaureus]KAG1823661.1 hypothetical protein BJ212DRAFT_1325845 [Suillus subaureus]
MASVAQSQHQLPKITVLNRVVSIPLIASSLEQINAILEKNTLTRSPYHAAQAITNTAYNYSQPIQIRLAPLIDRADGIANKGLDAVESRYPYPFQAKPEEVANYVRGTAGKTFENVKSPVVDVAEGIDKKFAPVVDYFERIAGNMSNESGGSSLSSPSSDSQYQYQRAINLSKHLKDNFYVYSSEHLKQAQLQHVMRIYAYILTNRPSVNARADTANSISALTSSGINNAQTAFHSVAENLLSEMQKIHQSIAQLPQTLQATYPDISKTVVDLRDTITNSSLPVPEKINRVGREVKERVSPLLEKLTQRISEIISVLGSKAEEAKNTAEANGNNVNFSPESASPQ